MADETIDDDAGEPADDTEEHVHEHVDDEAGDEGVDDADDGEPVALDTHIDPIAAARRMHGKGGAMVAAGMFGLEIAMGIKQKPDSVQVQEAPTDPVDVDKNGITVMIDAVTTVEAPALERRSPIGVGKKKRSR